MIYTNAAAVPPPSCHRHCSEYRHHTAVATTPPPRCRQVAPAKLLPPSCPHRHAIAKLPPPSRCVPPPLCRCHRSAAKLPPTRCCRRRTDTAATPLLLRRQAATAIALSATNALPPPQCPRQAAATKLPPPSCPHRHTITRLPPSSRCASPPRGKVDWKKLD